MTKENSENDAFILAMQELFNSRNKQRLSFAKAKIKREEQEYDVIYDDIRQLSTIGWRMVKEKYTIEDIQILTAEIELETENLLKKEI